MSRILEVMEQLPEMGYTAPVSEQEINSVEQRLRVSFAKEYREYLSVYGMVYSDVIAVSGICADEDYHVAALTERLRPFYPGIPSDFYVIEDVGVDGLVIWQNAAGLLYQSVPGGKPVKIFDSLSDFLSEQIEE